MEALQKNSRLNYETTHRRIENVITEMVKEGATLTVAEVAKRAKVCLSTAYNHNVKEMLSEIIKKADATMTSAKNKQ